MGEQLFNPDKWLNLGVAGAALFIVLTLVVLIFKQQSNSIDKLCDRLDTVSVAFAESNLVLKEVLICNDKDQKELLRHINLLSELVQDTHSRVVRLDVRLYEISKKGEIVYEVDKERNN